MTRPLAIILCLAAFSCHAAAAELAGKINGADWKAVAALKRPVQLSEDSTSYSISAEALDPKMPFGTKPLILLKILKKAKVGDAIMGNGKTITLFTPPGTNKAFDDGSAIITAMTATTVTVTFDAKLDKDNWVKGEFVIPIGE